MGQHEKERPGMQRIFAITAMACLGIVTATMSQSSASTTKHHRAMHTVPLSLEGIAQAPQALQAQAANVAAMQAQEAARLAETKKYLQAMYDQAHPKPKPQPVVRHYASTPTGGACGASKPAGFPDYIIQRESGGDPGARNSNGGAYGCAQIMPEHFRPGGGCAGMSYDECWSYLWAGGRGAANWACTHESGCS